MRKYLKNLIPIIISLLIVATGVGAVTKIFPYQGGTGQDTSGWSGMLKVDSGTWATSSGQIIKTVCASTTADTLVCDYTCDGTDDNVQIQEAINSVSSTGGVVYLKEGTYNISGTITIADNVTVEGAGWGTALRGEGNFPIFDLPEGTGDNPDVTHISIKDLYLDGNRANTTSSIGIYGAYSQEFSINNVLFVGFTDSCIKLTTCKKFNITDSQFGATRTFLSNYDNCYISSGVRIGTGGDIQFIGNRVHKFTVAGLVLTASSEKAQVIGNDFYAVGNMAIQMGTVAGSIERYINIIGNTFANVDYGIYNSGTDSLGINIIGNSFRNINKNAIRMRGKSHAIEDNYIYDPGDNGSGDELNGIFLWDYAENDIVSGNRIIADNGKMTYAISESDYANNNQIVNNPMLSGYTVAPIRRGGFNTIVLYNQGYIGSPLLGDTDESNRLSLKWNENATNDATLNLSLSSATSVALTIEGDSMLNQDLTSDASPMFAGLTDTGLTAGSVLFAGTGGLVSQDNSNLFWDNTNKRLGIGTNSPSTTLDVNGDLTVSGTTTLKSSFTGVLRADNGVVSTTTALTSESDPIWIASSTAYLTTSTAASTYVSRTDWTTIDSYPTACPSGYYVQGIGDTLTCAADQNTTYTAGRSLTLTGTRFDADPELYTDTKCIYIEDPTADDDLQSIWRSTIPITFTKVWAKSDQTVDFNLVEDYGTATSSIMAADLEVAAGENSTTTFADAAFAAESELDLSISSVANTPTWVSICFTYEKND